MDNYSDQGVIQMSAIASFTQTTLPPASLIICSRNRPKPLAELVVSILQGDELPTEIIIIDDSESRHERLASMSAGDACELRSLRDPFIFDAWFVKSCGEFFGSSAMCGASRVKRAAMPSMFLRFSLESENGY